MSNIFQLWKILWKMNALDRRRRRDRREQRRRWTDKRFIDEKLAGEIIKKWKPVKDEQK